MEKTSRRLFSTTTSSSILSFLPNGASFSSHRPHSRGDGDVMKLMQQRGFSGPMVSIVPMEARRRKHKGGGGGFDEPEEPTSPKVTCMGQIKLRKMAARCSAKQKPRADARRRGTNERMTAPLLIRGIFRRCRKARSAAAEGGGGSADVRVAVGSRRSTSAASAAAAPPRAPLLGQMRRFASGRESLGEFDWRKTMSGEDESEEEEEEVLVPHSAPLMGGNGFAALEPRKEVNLWKRRTLPPPTPLQLN